MSKNLLVHIKKDSYIVIDEDDLILLSNTEREHLANILDHLYGMLGKKKYDIKPEPQIPYEQVRD